MNTEPAQLIIPENFKEIVRDFTNDLSNTFPEYSYLWKKWNDVNCPEEEITLLFKHLMAIIPERFFDILYQNEDIFKKDSEINTEFFPGVDFKYLFYCEGISDTTRQTIWKYFQLLLFTVINSIQNKSIFGETMNLFDSIDENELQSKLQETMSGIGDFFSKNSDSSATASATEATDDQRFDEFSKQAETMFEGMPGFKNSFDFENMSKGMPNPAEMHEHLKGIFDGKIGKIAKEMAEEISNDMNGLFADDAEIKTTQDVFKKLLKNPAKMMELVKFVGNKLNAKMQSGELSQDDIMKEAGDIIGKMKDMGGGDDMKELIKNMAKHMGMGNNAKVNMGAMNNMMNKERMKERMRAKMEKKQPPVSNGVIEQKTDTNFVFKMDTEKQEKSSARPTISVEDMDELINDIEKTNAMAEAALNQKKKKKKSKK